MSHEGDLRRALMIEVSWLWPRNFASRLMGSVADVQDHFRGFVLLPGRSVGPLGRAWGRRRVPLPGDVACCKARTESIWDSFAAGLASTALTGLPLDTTTHRRNTDRRLCCPLDCSSITAASDAHPHPFHGGTGYKTRLSGDKLAGHRAGERLPSSRRHYLYVPRPIRRRVLGGCDFRFFTASIGLHREFSGSAPSVPTLTGRLLTTLQVPGQPAAASPAGGGSRWIRSTTPAADGPTPSARPSRRPGPPGPP